MIYVSEWVKHLIMQQFGYICTGCPTLCEVKYNILVKKLINNQISNNSAGMNKPGPTTLEDFSAISAMDGSVGLIQPSQNPG